MSVDVHIDVDGMDERSVDTVSLLISFNEKE
jgi:hypothetical protein